MGILSRLANDARRKSSIMSAQPVGTVVRRGGAALAVDGSDAVLGDVGGGDVFAFDLMGLRDLLVQGHHAEQAGRLVDAGLAGERARGAARAGGAGDARGAAAGARVATAACGAARDAGHARRYPRVPLPATPVVPPLPARRRRRRSCRRCRRCRWRPSCRRRCPRADGAAGPGAGRAATGAGRGVGGLRAGRAAQQLRAGQDRQKPRQRASWGSS